MDGQYREMTVTGPLRDALSTAQIAGLIGTPKQTVRNWSTRKIRGEPLFHPNMRSTVVEEHPEDEWRRFTYYDACVGAVMAALLRLGLNAVEAKYIAIKGPAEDVFLHSAERLLRLANLSNPKLLERVPYAHRYFVITEVKGVWMSSRAWHPGMPEKESEILQSLARHEGYVMLNPRVIADRLLDQVEEMGVVKNLTAELASSD